MTQPSLANAALSPRDILAEASFENDVYVHNDPPLWDGPEDMSLSPNEKAQYFDAADHIIERLARAGFSITPTNPTAGVS